MNLKQIRKMVKNTTDYQPELQVYNNQLDEIINQAYYNVWTRKRWNFATKEYFFKFNPDITSGRDFTFPDTANAVSILVGTRQVTFDSAMDRLTSDWEGQVIQLGDRDFGISKVVSTTELLIDEPFPGPALSSSTDYKMKFRYYDLPNDCLELLSLGHKDEPFPGSSTPAYAKVLSVMPGTDDQIGLRRDQTGSYAEAYVFSPAISIPSGEQTSLSQSAFVGGFVSGTHLEVCWAFVKDDKIGPLSEPDSIQFGDSDASLTITFKSWDDQDIAADAYEAQDTIPQFYEGYRKVVFWNANYNRSTGERLGLPCWKEFNQGGARASSSYLLPVVVSDSASSVTITSTSQIEPGNSRYIEYDGQHQRIRPFPRVDAWDEAVSKHTGTAVPPTADVLQDYLRYGVGRYYKKPVQLTLTTDSPEFPVEFHMLIVYRALQDIYEKLGDMSMSSRYESRIEKEVKRLAKRYVNRTDSYVRRGQFGLGGGNAWYQAGSVRKLN